MLLVGQGSSILEVAVGLNLVVPGLFAVFAATQASVLAPILEQMKRDQPEIPLTRARKAHLRALLLSFYPGMRIAERTVGILVGLSLTIVVVTVVALARVWLEPEAWVPRPVALSYAVVAVGIVPLMYPLVALFLRWLADELEAELVEHDSLRQKIATYFWEATLSSEGVSRLVEQSQDALHELGLGPMTEAKQKDTQRLRKENLIVECTEILRTARLRVARIEIEEDRT